MLCSLGVGASAESAHGVWHATATGAPSSLPTRRVGSAQSYSQVCVRARARARALANVRACVCVCRRVCVRARKCECVHVFVCVCKCLCVCLPASASASSSLSLSAVIVSVSLPPVALSLACSLLSPSLSLSLSSRSALRHRRGPELGCTLIRIHINHAYCTEVVGCLACMRLMAMTERTYMQIPSPG